MAKTIVEKKGVYECKRCNARFKIVASGDNQSSDGRLCCPWCYTMEDGTLAVPQSDGGSDEEE